MKQEIKAVLDKYGLTVESIFVLFSQSRNAEEESPSLNWKVTLKCNGRKVLTTDYMAGCGHAPSYKQGKQSYDDRQLIKAECETGYACTQMWAMGHIQPMKNKPILPDAADVIYSLLMDSEVLQYSSFEEWAGEFGYDQDSRSAEETYKACLKIALQFNRLGESAISELREVFQDY
jgi:hypothetical protein